jgi:hypothetical protein
MNSKRLGLLLGLAAVAACARGVQRDEVSFRRGGYLTEFYDRHRGAYRIGAAIHVAHGLQHDVLLLSRFEDHQATDAQFDRDMMEQVRSPPRLEPHQELFAPHTSQVMWEVLRTIDWTHMLHEQTYDIMSDDGIAWPDKKAALDASVRYYLEKTDVAFSPAPLDVTMRRVAVMMKPYATVFRTSYPRSNDFFYAAHWWHPTVYEAMMIGGSGRGQIGPVREVDALYHREVLSKRPKRMLLSREVMPRYARLSPESANVFDNLHMFHGIVYDTLAYRGWTPEQKRAELYRVIEAMRYRPGDEELARKFAVPHADMDPRRYEEWMVGVEGEMNRIMMEMMEEMMPSMMPGGMSPELRERHMDAFRKKLEPGLQEGEVPGSIMDAMKALMPDMKMSPESMAPGASDPKMVETMLAGWREKHGGRADAEPWPMDRDPAQRGGER